MKFNTSISNADYIVLALLKALKIRANKNTVTAFLKEHPNYPSLLSISDCLKKLKIKNEAYKIEKSEYDATELIFPFLASIQESGRKFVLVKNIENAKVSYKDDIDGNMNVPEEDFLKMWDGIALHARKDIYSGEENYWDNKIKYILHQLVIPSAFFVMIWIMFILFQNGLIKIPFPGLVLTKFIALMVSMMLLSQSYGIENSTIQNICKIGNSDCSKLLRSDAAKLTSWLSWSEVGFFYFASTFLSILLKPDLIYLLVWLNLICLPYSVYSIGYQYKNNKWCALCCTVQILIWIEFISAISLGLFSGIKEVHFIDFVNLLLYLSIPTVAWGFLKPLLNYKVEVGGLKFQLYGFKYNADLFNQALYNQPRYAIPDNIKPIAFGNRESETVITIVSDPFCSPCIQTHAIAKAWMSEGENIKINMLFHVADDESDPGAEVASHIISLNEQNHVLAERALEDWYSGKIKDLKVLSEEYPARPTLESRIVSQKQREWCKIADITYTPTVLINGYKVPMPYKIDDVKNLLY
jgi:Vitamin K epoxide reductase family/Peptidase C39 family/Thioredoxin